MKGLLAFVVLAALCTPAFASAVDPTVAARLLKALKDGDETALRHAVNNDRILDPESVRWLIGGEDIRPGGNQELRSAMQVLRGEVLTKIVITEQYGGPTIMEVLYLPVSTAESFGELALLGQAGRVRNYRDYMMCEFLVEDGRTYMRNICFADTDIFQ